MNRNFILAGVVMLALLTLAGCPTPTVLTEYELPSQDMRSRSEEGLARVVFFNASNELLFGLDQSGFVAIKINNKGLATLKIGSYVQIFLDKGEYDLYLAHQDMILFENNYKLAVDKDEVFVKVFAEAVSTNYKIVDRLPANFSQKYQPAYIMRK
jgi:hypothetical protein